MSSIQLTSSSSSGNTFNIWNVAEAYNYDATLGISSINQSGILYTQGCNDIEPQNCTTACQDPAQIFKSPYTLQNCMVLSALAPSNWMQRDDTSLDWTQPLSDEAEELAIDFAINTTSPDFPSLASNVTKTITGCFEKFKGPSANNQQAGYVMVFQPWYYPGDNEGFLGINVTDAPLYSTGCPFEVPLNEDIGGIGVSHRYAG